MIEGNKSPTWVLILITVGVHVKLQFSLLLLLELIENCVDVLEIRPENSSLICFSDLQNESSGTGSIGFHFVYPRDTGSKKIIIDYLSGIEKEDDFVRFFSGEEVGKIGVLHGSQSV
uniref:Uncharacterized protein n=1 Tax=Manihot esculenta TaxID=3983 RepID=A0A2C9WPH1_MANES